MKYKYIICMNNDLKIPVSETYFNYIVQHCRRLGMWLNVNPIHDFDINADSPIKGFEYYVDKYKIGYCIHESNF